MSAKQDRQGARTVTDLERKYNFGQTFAEVFGLIADANKAAAEANKAVAGLDNKLNHEEIFNRLTDNGKVQGIYRGDNDDIYINATYIKSGTLAAERIDADNLKVKAANITGALTIGQLPDSVATTGALPTKVSQLTNDSGYQTESGVTTIVGGLITTDYVEALGIKTSKLTNDAGYQTSSGVTSIVGGMITTDFIEALDIKVAAANITGLLSAAQIKLGGAMTIYEALDSDASAGTIGYEEVDYGAIFSGRALGIRGVGHAMVTASGHALIYSGLNTYIGAEGGISMAGTDLYWNGSSLISRIVVLETVVERMLGMFG